MKKALSAVVLSSLCITFAACSDDGEKLTIEDCLPPIYVQARALNETMTAKTECLDKASAMSTYIEANKTDLTAAADDYKKYLKTESWDSVGNVMCNTFSAVMLAKSYTELKGVKDQITTCTAKLADLSADAKKSWDSAVNSLTDIDGWNQAMDKAVDAAIEADKNTPNK